MALAGLLPKLSQRKGVNMRALAAVLIGGVALAALGFGLRDTIDRLVVGVQAWLQHPVFGGGLGTFLLGRETSGLQAVVIHSVPVWFLAEMGLVGLAAYAFFVASLFFCGGVALWRKDPRATGLLIAVAVFGLMGLVHDLFFQRTFWFASGLMVLLAGEVAARPLDVCSTTSALGPTADKTAR